MSAAAIPMLQVQIPESPYLWLEDIFLTGVVRTLAGVKLHILKKRLFGYRACMRMKSVCLKLVLFKKNIAPAEYLDNGELKYCLLLV